MASKELSSDGTSDDSYCKGCFTGRYPIPVQLEMDKLALEPAGV